MRKTGRVFFSRRLTKNLTPFMMRKLRKRVKAAFYIGSDMLLTSVIIMHTSLWTPRTGGVWFFTNRKRASLEEQLCCSRRMAESARVWSRKYWQYEVGICVVFQFWSEGGAWLAESLADLLGPQISIRKTSVGIQRCPCFDLIWFLYFHFHLTNINTKYLKNKYSERRSGKGKM